MDQVIELLSLSPPGWGGNLLRGLLHSLEIAFGAFGFGLLIGLGGACGKLYGGPVLRDLLAVYTTVVRAVPELVLILILYYVGTDLINKASEAMGYGRVEISGVAAGLWVLGNATNSYTGTTTIANGTLQATAGTTLESTMLRARFRRFTVVSATCTVQIFPAQGTSSAITRIGLPW